MVFGIVFLVAAAALAIAFVPSVHTWASSIWTTARDDLDKLEADTVSLVSRYSTHAVVKTAEADAHVAAAAVSATAAAAATTAATTAKAVAADLSSAVSKL